MNDWLILAEASARDPFAILIVFALAGIAIHLRFRKFPLWRAITRVLFLALLTLTLLHAKIVPYKPLELTDSPLRDAVGGILKIIWWLGTAWFIVGLLRAFVIAEQGARGGKLLQDLFAGLVYLTAFFAIIAYVFDLPIQGLLATSGAIAIILGLALQSTLGDLFSGLVLNFSRPYRPGDWINLEGGTNGRVIEMNWRATNILTGRQDLAIVPNSTIAKSKIINVSSPSGVHGNTVALQLDTRTPPSLGIEVLKRALVNSHLITETPSPTVVVKAITAAYTEFEITFFVANLDSVTEAQNELFDMAFRHLVSAGLEPALPENMRYRVPESESAKVRTPVQRVLALVDIFHNLAEDDRTAIAAKIKQHSHDRGETLVEPGTVLQSLFIVAGGVLLLAREGAARRVELRLGPGEHFGEIGLLTGKPSIAKITALTPAIVYELAKADIVPVLEARPEVSQEICRTLAQRQAMGRSTAAVEMDQTVPLHSLVSWFSDRLRRLYEISTSD